MSNHLYRKDKPKKTVYDDIRMLDNIYDEKYGDANIPVCYECLLNKQAFIKCDKLHSVFGDDTLCIHVKKEFQDYFSSDIKRTPEERDAMIKRINVDKDYLDIDEIEEFLASCESRIKEHFKDKK